MLDCLTAATKSKGRVPLRLYYPQRLHKFSPSSRVPTLGNSTPGRKWVFALERSKEALENHFLPRWYTLRQEARTKPLMKFSAPGTWSLLISHHSRRLTAWLGLHTVQKPFAGLVWEFPQASPRHIPSLPLCVSLFLFPAFTLSPFLSFLKSAFFLLSGILHPFPVFLLSLALSHRLLCSLLLSPPIPSFSYDLQNT